MDVGHRSVSVASVDATVIALLTGTFAQICSFLALLYCMC